MKQLKLFLAFLAAIHVPAYAGNPYMEGARQAVESSRLKADAFADRLVAESFYNTLFRVLKGVNIATQQSSAYDTLINETNNLEHAFLQFANKSPAEAGRDQASLRQQMEEYQDLFRKMVDLSFVPSEISMVTAQVPAILLATVKEYREVCKYGRASVDFSADIPAAPEPNPYVFDLDVYGSNTGKVRAEYQSVDYRHNSRENFMKNAEGTTAAAFTAAGMTGGVVSTVALATGGAGLVVIAALATISYFSGKQKEYDMMTEYVDAEIFKHKNTKRTQYVAERFRDGCKKNLDTLEEISQVIQLASSSPEETERLKSSLTKEKAEIDLIHEKLNQFNQAKCQIDLANRYTAQKCVNKDSRQECSIQDHHIQNAICSVELDGKGKPDVRAAREIQGQLQQEKFIENNLRRLVVYEVSKALTVDREELIKALSQASFNSLYEAQDRAFRQLMLIYTSYQSLLESRDPNSQKLMADLKISEEYERLNGQFLELVASGIRMVFGKVSISDFKSQRDLFGATLQKFAEINGQVPMVHSLVKRFDALKNTISTEL